MGGIDWLEIVWFITMAFVAGLIVLVVVLGVKGV